MKEFEQFALQGNVLDLAVGVMIGGAFSTIVSSLVSDIFMPIIGLITGGIDFSGLFVALDGQHYASAQAATDAGVGVLSYGAFITNVINFILIALVIFLFVKMVNRLTHKEPAAPPEPTRVCPFCKTTINAAATRCPNCTSELTSVPAEPTAT